MTITPRGASSRRGFTMIELLVVILIIGVLVGLLLPAVLGVRNRADVAKAQHEISQITTGIENWKSSNNAKYLIDNIKMVSGVTNNMGTPVINSNTADKLGFEWLKRTWPRLVAVDPAFTPATPILTNNIPDVTLSTGNQCLVYFLLGPTGQGLNQATTDPLRTQLTLAKPYMDWPSNRIVNNEMTDPWGTPYAYFVSRGSLSYQNAAAQSANTEGGVSSVSPYVDPSNQPYTMGSEKFMNQNSYQIVSAGPDQVFGPGGRNPNTPKTGQSTSQWTPGSGVYQEGYQTGSQKGGGFDDLSNFSGGKQLGVK